MIRIDGAGDGTVQASVDKQVEIKVEGYPGSVRIGIPDGFLTGGGGGVTDHQELTGREVPGSHPTVAITGLDAALSGKVPLAGGVMTGQLVMVDGSSVRNAIGPATLTVNGTPYAGTYYEIGSKKRFFVGTDDGAFKLATFNDAGTGETSKAMLYWRGSGDMSIGGKLTAPGGMDAGGSKVTGMISTGLLDVTDAAPVWYVDQRSAGLDAHLEAKCATVSVITLSGTPIIDGYQTVIGDRVLVRFQHNGSVAVGQGVANGIYIVAAGAWARAVDANSNGSLKPGSAIAIISGNTYANTLMVCQTRVSATPWAPGTDDNYWVIFTSRMVLQAGGGLILSGNTVSIVAADSSMAINADSVAVVSAPRWTAGRTIALTGDITGTSAVWDGSTNIAFATAITAGAIIDADINGSAAIAQSKVANLVADIGAKESSVNKGTIGGYAPLDSAAKVPSVNLPVYPTVITDHAALSGRSSADAHPTTAITGLDTALAGKEAVGAANSAVAAHAGASDPHIGYQKESDKGIASGYASLDAAIKVPLAQIPTGTTASTVALGDAAGVALAAHVAAVDPHIGYQKESDKGIASGYASLDATIKVPYAQIPTGTAASTIAIGNHAHTGVYWTLWSGTLAAYNAIGTKDANTLYCVTG